MLFWLSELIYNPCIRGAKHFFIKKRLRACVWAVARTCAQKIKVQFWTLLEHTFILIKITMCAQPCAVFASQIWSFKTVKLTLPMVRPSSFGAFTNFPQAQWVYFQFYGIRKVRNPSLWFFMSKMKLQNNEKQSTYRLSLLFWYIDQLFESYGSIFSVDFEVKKSEK